MIEKAGSANHPYHMATGQLLKGSDLISIPIVEAIDQYIRAAGKAVFSPNLFGCAFRNWPRDSLCFIASLQGNSSIRPDLGLRASGPCLPNSISMVSLGDV